MSRPLYRGFSGGGGGKDRCADEGRHYDPKEPSENGIGAGGCGTPARGRKRHLAAAAARIGVLVLAAAALVGSVRSEERRVGKECRN